MIKAPWPWSLEDQRSKSRRTFERHVAFWSYSCVSPGEARQRLMIKLGNKGFHTFDCYNALLFIDFEHVAIAKLKKYLVLKREKDSNSKLSAGKQVLLFERMEDISFSALTAFLNELIHYLKCSKSEEHSFPYLL